MSCTTSVCKQPCVREGARAVRTESIRGKATPFNSVSHPLTLIYIALSVGDRPYRSPYRWRSTAWSSNRCRLEIEDPRDSMGLQDPSEGRRKGSSRTSGGEEDRDGMCEENNGRERDDGWGDEQACADPRLSSGREDLRCPSAFSWGPTAIECPVEAIPSSSLST